MKRRNISKTTFIAALYYKQLWTMVEAKEMAGYAARHPQVYICLVKQAREAWDEESNEEGRVITSYAEIGRKTKLDTRTVKKTLNELEAENMLYSIRGKTNIMVTVTLSDVYAEKGVESSVVLRKKEKEKKEKDSPRTPFSIKKEKKKEKKGVGKEENTHTPLERFAEEKEDNLEIRRKRFEESVRPYVEEYGKAMCNEFYAHWTEPTQDGRQMRFELERTWSTAARLAKWKRTEFASKEVKGGRRSAEVEAQDRAAKAQREAERRDNERARDEAALQSVPLWALQAAKRNGLNPESSAAKMGGFLDGLRGTGRLTAEEEENLEAWLTRRMKLMREFKRKWCSEE